MKNKATKFLILIALSFLSCSKNVNKQIEGVYTVDKELLKTKLASDSKPISPVVSRFLDKKLENTLMEFQIKKDSSIYGILSFAGDDPVLLNDKLQKKNKFLMFGDGRYILNRTNKGVSFKRLGTSRVFDFIKTNRIELSSKAKGAIEKETKEKRWKSKYGVWKIDNYKNDFGDTKGAYITTTVYGTFSNSATTDSNLKVKFIIDNKQVRLKFYEYAGNHPTKNSGIFFFKIRDNYDRTYLVKAYNSSSGYIEPSKYGRNDNKKLRKILTIGGEIEFSVSNSDYSSSSYKFKIDNADGLDNILKKISQ